MGINQSKEPTARPQSMPLPNGNNEPEPVYMIGVSLALQDIAQRLISVEEKLGKGGNAESQRGSNFIEVCKVVFGGWPALGFLFLFLFYSPLRDALNAIPDKVKSANEMSVLGVSLKTTIQNEATKLGATKLSETIPRLSSTAIEYLLRAPQNQEALVSYTTNHEKEYESINFPDSSVLEALSELQSQGLIEIKDFAIYNKSLTADDVTMMISEFRKKYPGHEELSSRNAVTWTLKTPLPENTRIPNPSWELTDIGKKAVEIILRAVSTELSPKPEIRK